MTISEGESPDKTKRILEAREAIIDSNSSPLDIYIARQELRDLGADGWQDERDSQAIPTLHAKPIQVEKAPANRGSPHVTTSNSHSQLLSAGRSLPNMPVFDFVAKTLLLLLSVQVALMTAGAALFPDVVGAADP